MSALSENKMIIENLSDSDDTRVIINALASDEKEKDIGHAGTAMRFLTAYYALMPGEVILTGSERMKNRPVGELTEILCKLGANIEYIERDGYPPIKIKGGNLKSRDIEINSSISSQYISALLMIAPMLEKGLKIKLKGKTTSASYINLTIELMKKAGIQCNWKCDEILVSPGKYLAGKFYVEPDWSGASYWYAIASLAKEAEILLEGLEQNSLQGDFAVKSIFEKLGVKTTFTAGGALLKNTGKWTKHFNFNFILNPDLVQTIVPVCVSMKIPFHITGTKTLLIKETDRIKALICEMQKFGAYIESDPDGEWMKWDGIRKKHSKNPQIDTYNDHRMALGIAPVCLKEGSITIRDSGVVSKSYPTYWEDLKKAGFSISNK